MTKSVLSIIILAIVLLFVAVTNPLHSQHGNVLASAADPLNLSMEQQKAMVAIVQKELETVNRISGDTMLSPNEKLDQIRKVTESARLDGLRVLTVDQQKILGTLKEKHLGDIQSQSERDLVNVFVLQIVNED